MFALIDDQGNLSRVCTEDRCEWGGAYHSSLRLMAPGERRRFRIYDLADSPGIPIDGGVTDGETVTVDHVSGTVFRIQRWRERTDDEKKAKRAADALAALDELDRGSPRKVEDLFDLLIQKGIVSLEELPQKTQDWLGSRKTKRVEYTANRSDLKP